MSDGRGERGLMSEARRAKTAGRWEARGGEARGGEARGGEARGGEARGGEARGGTHVAILVPAVEERHDLMRGAIILMRGAISLMRGTLSCGRAT
jgi:hypothetical protein